MNNENKQWFKSPCSRKNTQYIIHSTFNKRVGPSVHLDENSCTLRNITPFVNKKNFKNKENWLEEISNYLTSLAKGSVFTITYCNINHEELLKRIAEKSTYKIIGEHTNFFTMIEIA